MRGRNVIWAAGVIGLLGAIALAQTEPADADAAFKTTVTERADKILEPLRLDAAKESAVRDVMVQHYFDLRAWDAAYQPKLKSLQNDLNAASKAKDDAAADKAKADIAGVKGTKVPMHEQFVRSMAKLLPFTQVNQIKDGMTYGLVANRLAIMEKLGLSDDQRTEIRDMLVATREIAMDAGSSDEKHKLFGETMGRVSLRVLNADQNAALEVLKGKPPKKPTTAK